MRSTPKVGNMAHLRALALVFATSLITCQASAQATVQESISAEADQKTVQIESVGIIPIQTDSPRSSLETLYRLRDELELSLGAYWQNQTRSNAVQKSRFCFRKSVP